MKIGLITVYYANYGSYFQGIALQRYLESLGHECEFVNATVRGKYIWKFLLGKFGYKVLPKTILKKVAKKVAPFRIYSSLAPNIEKLPISTWKTSPKHLSKKYDAILIGSDELWSWTNPDIKFIPAYFGEDITIPVFSYATSGASLRNPDEQIVDRVSRSIKKFVALSGRDTKTCEFVRQNTNKECVQCIDPTLLNPFFVDLSKAQEKGYILVYGIDFSDKQIQEVQKFAKDNNYIIKGVSWKHDWFDEFVEEIESAEEFLTIFANASYCMVSTFHGVIFSVLHRKNFTAFLSEARYEKVTDLLATLKLEHRIYNEKSLQSPEDIDYDAVEDNLKQLRIKSKEYLVEALDNIESSYGNM